VVDDAVSDMEAHNDSMPKPIATKQFSGKFMVRVPPYIHRTLAILAAESGASLNSLASAKLSQ